MNSTFATFERLQSNGVASIVHIHLKCSLFSDSVTRKINSFGNIMLAKIMVALLISTNFGFIKTTSDFNVFILDF